MCLFFLIDNFQSPLEFVGFSKVHVPPIALRSNSFLPRFSFTFPLREKTPQCIKTGKSLTNRSFSQHVAVEGTSCRTLALFTPSFHFRGGSVHVTADLGFVVPASRNPEWFPSLWWQKFFPDFFLFLSFYFFLSFFLFLSFFFSNQKPFALQFLWAVSFL